jgi:hypothetical protein
MTTRFDSKDPAEEITAAFDYSGIGVPSSPDVTIGVRRGTDPDVAAMLQGGATVSGSRVLQRIRAGVSGAEYEVRCMATAAGDRVLIDAILPVTRRPTAAT